LSTSCANEAFFGRQNKIIDQRQYTMLVSTVILSAFAPTLIAHKLFQPTTKTIRAWGGFTDVR
jgi:hypothetical protein